MDSSALMESFHGSACTGDWPGPGKHQGEEESIVRPMYLPLVILGKMMLVVDLGLTCVGIGASVLGSAVYWILCMLSQRGKANTGKASPTKKQTPAMRRVMNRSWELSIRQGTLEERGVGCGDDWCFS